VTIGAKAAKCVQQHLKDIPMVYCMVLNPAEITGKNVTGVTMRIPCQTILKEIRNILPGIKKIGLVYSDKTAPEYEEMLRCDNKEDLQIIGSRANSEQELAQTLEKVLGQSEVFMMMADAVLYSKSSIKNLFIQGLKRGVPIMGLSATYTRAGALFSVECNYTDVGRQTGQLVEKVLRGELIIGLKPVAPQQVRYTVNLVVAARLGITIPESVIAKASEVVK
jgi:putative tryptophan/tyrosine transport system substrate-binding protein